MNNKQEMDALKDIKENLSPSSIASDLSKRVLSSIDDIEFLCTKSVSRLYNKLKKWCKK